MSSAEQSFSARQAMLIAVEHYQAGRLPEAESQCRQVLAAEPENADAFHLLGVIAHRAKDGEKAVELIETAIRLHPAPSPPYFLNSLGEVYRALHRPDEAEVPYRRALQLDPGFAEAHNNLANALKALRRLDEAEQHYRRAIELKPDYALAKLNYSLLQLVRGDFARGFPLYENRFAAGDPGIMGPARAILGALTDTPRWQGEDLKSATLMVWTEQGLGDSLMMMRYLPRLGDHGVGRLIVYCEPALARIMQSVAGVDEVYWGERPPAPEKFQCHCPAMSLPLLLGTRLETIPKDVPYVKVPEDLRQKWADKLSGVARPRVGLVWAGGKHTWIDPTRSMTLASFSPLFSAVKATFLSLQKGDEARQIEQFDWYLADWMDECRDFLDTAGLIEQLDLVISVDTSVAHLAGALGKPVWLLSRFDGAWPWMLEREDSPWYPSMRIFRQNDRGNWTDVMQRVASALDMEFNRPDDKGTSIAPKPVSDETKFALWRRWLAKLKI